MYLKNILNQASIMREQKKILLFSLILDIHAQVHIKGNLIIIILFTII